MVAEVLDFLSVLRRQAIASGVRNVDHRCPRLDDRLDYPGEILVVRSSRIFGIELHVVDEPACVLHGRHRALDDFLAVGVELILDVRVGRTDSSVDSLVLRKLQCFHRHVDVLLHGPCKRADGRPSDGF